MAPAASMSEAHFSLSSQVGEGRYGIRRASVYDDVFSK